MLIFFSYISKFGYTRVYKEKDCFIYCAVYFTKLFRTYNFANLSIGAQLYCWWMCGVMHFVYLYVAKTRETDSTGDCVYTCSRVYIIYK